MSLAYIAHAPSHHGEDIQDFFKESPAGITTLTDFREDRAIPQKENAIGVACRESVVCHHQDRGSEIFVDTLNRRKQHLGRMTI